MKQFHHCMLIGLKWITLKLANCLCYLFHIFGITFPLLWGVKVLATWIVYSLIISGKEIFASFMNRHPLILWPSYITTVYVGAHFLQHMKILFTSYLCMYVAKYSPTSSFFITMLLHIHIVTLFWINIICESSYCSQVDFIALLVS